MINIKQITQNDLINITNIVQKTVIIGGNPEVVRTWDYKVIDEDFFQGRPFKLGYCCEDVNKDFPIYLTINGKEQEFQLGKTGMFEFQPENWTNVNDKDPQEQTAIVNISEAKVPTNVHFTLDYCIEI